MQQPGADREGYLRPLDRAGLGVYGGLYLRACHMGRLLPVHFRSLLFTQEGISNVGETKVLPCVIIEEDGRHGTSEKRKGKFEYEADEKGNQRA